MKLYDKIKLALLHQRKLRWMKSIDGQVCLVHFVHFVRLKMYNFRLFFVNKRTNDKLPFTRWANGERIKENRLGFRFPFEKAAYKYKFKFKYYIHTHTITPS